MGSFWSENLAPQILTFIGAYVARNLKSGRAITVPGFGVITFGAPFVKLDVVLLHFLS